MIKADDNVLADVTPGTPTGRLTLHLFVTNTTGDNKVFHTCTLNSCEQPIAIYMVMYKKTPYQRLALLVENMSCAQVLSLRC